MSNEVTVTEQKQLTAKGLFAREDVQKKFSELLGKKSQGFITSVLQIVSQNSLLAKADPNSVFQAAAMAATLDLPINSNLGFAYIIPYSTKVKGIGGKPDTYRDVAQFQMGYKGFIQLAQRSGQFKTISATPIYEGQITMENPLTGFEFDFTVKPAGDPVGYAAYFKLLNGFEKTLYLTVEELKKHGLKFSQTYKKGYGLWKDNFDAMALKTVTKLLLSKYAPLSIEMQSGIVTDQSIINDAGTEDITYIDNLEPYEDVNKVDQRLALMINDAKTIEDLEAVSPHISENLIDLFNERKIELGGK